MLSINMRVFKTVLLIAFFGVSVQCLPVADKPTESKTESQTESKPEVISEEVAQEIAVTTIAPTLTYSGTTDYYDQRQNGTENYRIHLNGLVFVFAPIEAMLLADPGSSESHLSSLLSSHGTSSTQSPVGELDKPTDIDSVHNKTEPAISKTIHKQPAVRLANLLAPFIRSIRHVQSTSVH